VRITWLEALCVLTIAVATLQLPAKDRARGTTMPVQAGSKATVMATNAQVLHLTKPEGMKQP
jgi:hypothetical protein